MVGKFLLMTKVEAVSGESPVIINLDNIGIVYTENGDTNIQMNYRRKDGWPETIHVKEDFEWVKNALEARR